MGYKFKCRSHEHEVVGLPFWIDRRAMDDDEARKGHSQSRAHSGLTSLKRFLLFGFRLLFV